MFILSLAYDTNNAKLSQNYNYYFIALFVQSADIIMRTATK